MPPSSASRRKRRAQQASSSVASTDVMTSGDESSGVDSDSDIYVQARRKRRQSVHMLAVMKCVQDKVQDPHDKGSQCRFSSECKVIVYYHTHASHMRTHRSGDAKQRAYDEHVAASDNASRDAAELDMRHSAPVPAVDVDMADDDAIADDIQFSESASCQLYGTSHVLRSIG
jgi:hypothetical protein